MSEKKIIIIGAGISGLATGCYLRMNGYDTEIFESHNVPGGLCTSWKRGGYTFDGCIHWLVGSGEGNSFNRLWKELNALKDTKIVDYDVFMHTEFPDGEKLDVYPNADDLEKELVRFAPEDAETIKTLIKAVKKASKLEPPSNKPAELMNFFDLMKAMVVSPGYIGFVSKWVKVSIDDFAATLKNERFRKNFVDFFNMPGEMSMVALIMTLAWLHKKSAGYPIGGSSEFIRKIEDTYRKLGGKIRYNSRVEKILVENGAATGIKLEGGETFGGDTVISSADGHSTIFDMLGEKFIDDEIKGYYTDLKRFPAIIQVSIGVGRTFDDLPVYTGYTIPLKESLEVDGSNTADTLTFRIYNFDPTLALSGKTVVTTFVNADYEYWSKLRKEDHDGYLKEKERILNAVVNALENRFGNFRDKIEATDVATPATYVRYTGNWTGSFEGFLPTPKAYTVRIKKTLPGLENFYMMSQWTMVGGGLPSGLLGGRGLAQIICRKDGKKFSVRPVD